MNCLIPKDQKLFKDLAINAILATDFADHNNQVNALKDSYEDTMKWRKNRRGVSELVKRNALKDDNLED